MKSRRFIVTLPLAIVVNAIVDILLVFLDLVLRLASSPLVLTKEWCVDEITKAFRTREQARKEFAELMKKIENKEYEVKE